MHGDTSERTSNSTIEFTGIYKRWSDSNGYFVVHTDDYDLSVREINTYS